MDPDPVSYYNPLHIAVLRNKPDMVADADISRSWNRKEGRVRTYVII